MPFMAGPQGSANGVPDGSEDWWLGDRCRRWRTSRLAGPGDKGACLRLPQYDLYSQLHMRRIDAIYLFKEFIEDLEHSVPSCVLRQAGIEREADLHLTGLGSRRLSWAWCCSWRRSRSWGRRRTGRTDRRLNR